MLVLTSAGVAAFVSGLITLVGQHLERRARREEILIQKALEIAVHRSGLALDVAKSTGVEASLYDEVINAATYYRWLKELLYKGVLPEDAQHRKGAAAAKRPDTA
jgi:hypothetical protein